MARREMFLVTNYFCFAGGGPEKDKLSSSEGSLAEQAADDAGAAGSIRQLRRYCRVASRISYLAGVWLNIQLTPNWSVIMPK